MKIFRTIGILAVALLIVSAFLPWAYINTSKLPDTLISGMQTAGTSLGKPGLMSIIFGILFLVTVLIPKLWAKRTGIFFAAVIIAWNIKNMFLFHCEMGYCPEKKIGLYLSLLAAIAILVSSVIPYMPEEEEE